MVQSIFLVLFGPYILYYSCPCVSLCLCSRGNGSFLRDQYSFSDLILIKMWKRTCVTSSHPSAISYRGAVSFGNSISPDKNFCPGVRDVCFSLSLLLETGLSGWRHGEGIQKLALQTSEGEKPQQRELRVDSASAAFRTDPPPDPPLLEWSMQDPRRATESCPTELETPAVIAWKNKHTQHETQERATTRTEEEDLFFTERGGGAQGWHLHPHNR